MQKDYGHGVKSSITSIDHYKLEEATLLLRSLSHPTRIKILNFLVQEGGATSKGIKGALPHCKSDVVTRHLNTLFASNLIDKDTSTQGEVIYAANTDKLERIVMMVSDFF